ncbi:MAG: alpha/beta fold hydrolase [Candidatus Acidiferrales bacterium]
MARKTNIALRLAIAASAFVGACSPASAFPKFHAKWFFHERAALESAALTPDTVADAHGFLESFDGTCLFYRYWPGAVAGNLHNDANPQEIVLVLHGIGAHAGPFRVVAEGLNPRGIPVYAMDTRGHGFSCGERDEVPDAATENRDIAAMVAFLHESYPRTRIYLLGYSMGGIFALNYASQENSGLAGLVLLAPAISVSTGQELSTALKNPLIVPCAMFCRSKPVISLTGDRLPKDPLSREEILGLRRDPLAYRKVSVRYVWELARETHGWSARAAAGVDVPTLIVRGDKDSLLPQKASKKLFAVIPATEKKAEAFPNVPHTALWTPETPKILESIADWVDQSMRENLPANLRSARAAKPPSPGGAPIETPKR